MDFDTLDKQMRKFEQSLERTMLEGIYVVARLDGHGFTRLTKKEWNLEKPFDVRFRDAMIETTKHLMNCGFRMIYGYTQSDEILFVRGINYNDLPLWQKRGVGMYYCDEQRQGYNPVTKETTSYTRRSLHLEMELPTGQEYSQIIKKIINKSIWNE